MGVSHVYECDFQYCFQLFHGSWCIFLGVPKCNSTFAIVNTLKGVIPIGKVELHFETLGKLRQEPRNNGLPTFETLDQSESE